MLMEERQKLNDQYLKMIHADGKKNITNTTSAQKQWTRRHFYSIKEMKLTSFFKKMKMPDTLVA